MSSQAFPNVLLPPKIEELVLMNSLCCVSAELGDTNHGLD